MNKTWIPTNDFTKGRKSYDYIVCHWGVTTALSQIDAEVLNQNRQMSYHYALSDDTVHQYVDEANTAWHASVWDINQRSIGICVNASQTNPYTDRDYETLARLCAEILERHPNMEIKGHRDFYATQCPGTLDFVRLKNRINELKGGNVKVWQYGEDIRFNDEQAKELMVNLSRKTPVNYHLRGWEVMQEIYTDNRAIIDGLNAQIASKDAVIASRDMSIKDLTEKYRKLDVDFDTYREDSADEIARLTKELKETKEKAVADLLVKQKKIDELEQIIKDKDLSKLSFWEKIIILFS